MNKETNIDTSFPFLIHIATLSNVFFAIFSKDFSKYTVCGTYLVS